MAGARTTDPGTSHLAAKHVNEPKLETLYYVTLKRIGHPLSTTEIARICGHGRDSFSPRSVGLVDRGIIKRAGLRFCENFQGNWSWMNAYALPEWPTPPGGWPTKPAKPEKAAKANRVDHNRPIGT